MNIKNILIGSSLAVAALFTGVPEAEASTCFNVPETGGAICNTYRGSNSYGAVYDLGYAVGNTRESMTVTCRGSYVVDFSSRGSMTQLGASRLANYFCSL